jgi:hypothetical protein
MKDSVDLVLTCGIDASTMDPMDIYMMAGKVLQDEPLRQAALKFLNGSVLEMDAYARAVAGMTPTERVALRERVTGVVQLPVK